MYLNYYTLCEFLTLAVAVEQEYDFVEMRRLVFEPVQVFIVAKHENFSVETCRAEGPRVPRAFYYNERIDFAVELLKKI